MYNKLFSLRKLFIATVFLGSTFSLALANGEAFSTSQEVSNQSNHGQQLQLTAVRSNAAHSNYPRMDATRYDSQGLFPRATPAESQAFQQVARKAMPLTPEQIMKFKQMMNITQRAAASSAETPPTPTLSTQIVNLSPGATPPVVRLQQGFVTSVVFVDNTGADWPIESYDLGNSRAFNLQWQAGSNTLMIQAVSMYTYGNLAVKLAGLSTPVMLTLVPGQKVVDYRVDLHVQGQGPHAKPISANGLPPGATNVLLSVLNDVPPTKAVRLKLDSADCEAWRVGERMYFRTRLTVLSPSWIAMMSSPDGTNAYELKLSSSVLVSKYGKPIEIKIENE